MTSREPVASVEVGAKDLEGPGVVFCPNRKMALWSAHPRVFLPIEQTGESRCPYCSTLYKLAGPLPKSGH